MTPKKIRKVILAQNCLKRKLTQLLEYTKKNDKKSRKKKSKCIFGSELSETNNELNFRLHQKMTKSRKKSKIIFGSEFSETNNESTFG